MFFGAIWQFGDALVKLALIYSINTYRRYSIDSNRTFSLTCRATIVARPFKFDTCGRFDTSLES